MSKKYVWSKRADRASLDTNATNMIRDILILLGMYDEFQNSHISFSVSQFTDYYIRNINVSSINSICRFVGEYHFYNRGVRFLREKSNQKTIKTYSKSIKRMCVTHRTKNICIPTNMASILYILFEYVYGDEILKYIFINKILCNCPQYTANIDHYPSDCTFGILGFVNHFFANMDNFNYSNYEIEVSENIKNAMSDIIVKYEVKECCILRNP